MALGRAVGELLHFPHLRQLVSLETCLQGEIKIMANYHINPRLTKGGCCNPHTFFSRVL